MSTERLSGFIPFDLYPLAQAAKMAAYKTQQEMSWVGHLAATSRLDAQTEGRSEYDTPFDHFMHEHVGDLGAVSGEASKSWRELPDGRWCNYDVPRVRSYSESGMLLVVRQTRDEGVEERHRTRIVTLDIEKDAEPVEWFIDEVKPSPNGDMNFYLNRRPYRIVPTETDMQEPLDELAAIQQEKRLRLQSARTQKRQPRLTLSNQGAVLKLEGEEHLFLEMKALVKEVDRFWLLAPIMKAIRDISRERRQASVSEPADNVVELFRNEQAADL